MSYAIQPLLDAPSHPAREASIRSIRAVEAGDRDAWLALFREDAVVQDPVGVSPLDPGGEGHRGIEAIARFYDTVIAHSETRFCVRQTFACGNECANVGTITARVANGSVGRTELVMVYCVDDAGKIRSLRAFWEFERSMTMMF